MTMISPNQNNSEEAQAIEKTLLICAARTGSQQLESCLRQSNIKIASSEVFTTNREHLFCPEIFDFDPAIPTFKLWRPLINRVLVDKAFVRCDLFKIHYYYLSSRLLEEIKTYRIIHLIRRNLFARYVSSEIAYLNNRWACDYVAENQIEIDQKKLIDDIIYHRAMRAEIDARCANRINIYYEDGVNANMKKICHWLGLAEFPYEIRTMRVVRMPLAKVVSNYDKLRAFDVNDPK